MCVFRRVVCEERSREGERGVNTNELANCIGGLYMPVRLTVRTLLVL